MYRISNQIDGAVAINNINFGFSINTKQTVYLAGALLQLLKQPAQLDRDTLLKLVYQEDLAFLHQAYQDLLEGNTVQVVKFRIVVESAVIWIAASPFLVHNGTDTLLLANVTIITPEVENLQTALKFANKKNSILQMLSHDLRGPLHIAKSLVSVLHNENLQPESLKKTEAISAIIAQTIALIEDLVDKEFLETVDAPLVKQRIDLVKKLTEYMEQCKRFEQVNERTFTLLSSSKSVLVALDEAKFMQVINNLMTNALKFTQPNGQISISITEDNDHVLIDFKDNGIGIPSQMLPFIFDRYTIAKRSGLLGEPTTGLGLFIVKEIITWHGGTISCHSKEGKGTTFTIKLVKHAR